MFIRLPKGKADLVISLHGKALDIIRLPDKSASKKHQSISGFNVALVVIHDVSKAPLPFYSDNDLPGEYWDSFTQLAEAETDNRMVTEPLQPLLNKICDAIANGEHLFDLNNEKTFIPYDKALKRGM